MTRIDLASSATLAAMVLFNTTFDPLFGADIFLAAHPMEPDLISTTAIYAADIDGDGDQDVITITDESFHPSDPHRLEWWENSDGSGTIWTKHLVKSAPYGDHAYVADLDGDGDLDILGTAHSDTITWWENINGNGTAWEERVVDESLSEISSVSAADIDGDSDLDIVGTATTDDDISWWENTNGEGLVWTKHTIDEDFDGADSAHAADLDGDGDLDVLGVATRVDNVLWWENTNGDGVLWTEHVVDPAFTANSIYATDLDGDSDLDVLATSTITDELSWWENNEGNGMSWARQIIEDKFDNANTVHVADMDGDGDTDVIATALWEHTIHWWENVAGDASVLKKHTVENDSRGTRSAFAADINGDGRMDIVAGGLNFGFDNSPLTWWENRRCEKPQLFVTGRCPGEVSISFGCGTGGAMMSISGSPSEGSSPVPDGQLCSGLSTGLDDPTRLVTQSIPPNGERRSIDRVVSAGVCGMYLQSLDQDACVLSNVERMPLAE